MSIIKSIKQVLGLHPAAENHFFDGSVPNELTLKRGTPEVPGPEVLAVDSTGKVGFSIGILGFSYTDGGGNGKAIQLPAWLGKVLIQWGQFSFTYTSAVQTHTWALPVPYSVSPASLISRNGGLATADSPTYDQAIDCSLTQGSIFFVTSGSTTAVTVSWLALGIGV